MGTLFHGVVITSRHRTLSAAKTKIEQLHANAKRHGWKTNPYYIYHGDKSMYWVVAVDAAGGVRRKMAALGYERV